MLLKPIIFRHTSLYQVVKLFNVIQQAQQSNTQTVSETAAVRGTGKASLPAPSADGFRDEKKKGKGRTQKDNAVGRAKPGTSSLSGSSFDLPYQGVIQLKCLYLCSCSRTGGLLTKHSSRRHCIESLVMQIEYLAFRSLQPN